MTKVVFRPAKTTPADQDDGAKPAVKQKRVLERRGTKTMLRIDAESFGDDLTAVFQRNVAKARRENKRLIGVPDRVPAKS